jgi:hypothetical protein
VAKSPHSKQWSLLLQRSRATYSAPIPLTQPARGLWWILLQRRRYPRSSRGHYPRSSPFLYCILLSAFALTPKKPTFSAYPASQFSCADIYILQILAIAEAFARCGNCWQYSRVCIHTDNSTAFNHSRKEQGSFLLRQVLIMAARNDTSLRSEWLSFKENALAGALTISFRRKCYFRNVPTNRYMTINSRADRQLIPLLGPSYDLRSYQCLRSGPQSPLCGS